MKTKSVIIISTLLLELVIHSLADPVGTAFTYQGRLADGGNPATGSYDLKFTLYDGGPGAVAGPLTNAAVPVSNGLFTVTLDFGAGAFTGDFRALEIGVRTNGGSDFTTLAPRQPLTPSPYALYAPNAGSACDASNLVGVLPSSQLAGTYTNPVAFANALSTFSGSNVTVSGSVSAEGDLIGARLNVGVGYTLTGGDATIAGGSTNANGDQYGSIGGGDRNRLDDSARWSKVGGGERNSVQGAEHATIGGGDVNTIMSNAHSSAIGGGVGNTILPGGIFGTIPGGGYNTATTNAFAAGFNAQATNQGAFVWADSTGPAFWSVAIDESVVRCTGGARLVTAIDTWGNPAAEMTLPPAGTSRASISDRNVKKDIVALDSRRVLEKLVAVPITQWRYQWEQPEDTPHIGPMAQDFKAVFFPGRNDKTITTQEADGVALAAIQGLNQKLVEELQQKQTEMAELKQRLERLERLMSQSLNGGRQ
jgi:hypothetical protein